MDTGLESIMFFKGNGYPICSNTIDEKVKKYKSLKVAENAAIRGFEYFSYVIKSSVEQVE